MMKLVGAFRAPDLRWIYEVESNKRNNTVIHLQLFSMEIMEVLCGVIE